MLLGIILLWTLIASSYSDDCKSRDYPDGTVCVCDSTYCDTVPDLNVSPGSYQIYSTSKSKLGFYSKTDSFATDISTEAIPIKVDPTIKYQTIIGFGGAFTDSAGINIKSLPLEAQEKLLESYFSDTGVQYSLCRVPIGGTDFSTRGYSHDDHENDTTLEHFSLAQDDFDYKIPFIKKAKELTNNDLKLLASAWTAPKWMKSNNDWSGVGYLKEEHYQLWVDYIVKFYDEYGKQNISYWGMTTQNEPIDGYFPQVLSSINSMGWTPSALNKWIGENLGPTIRNSIYKDLKIILHDDNRLTLFLLGELLENPTTMSYADGVAVHWYTDFFVPPTALNFIRTYTDDLFILSTEASNGYLAYFGLEEPVEKGSWDRGVQYANDILDDLEYGAGGWIDWNMALDETGGPTYINNNIDSAIIVNVTLQEFYKQPMFYVVGHFSKFIRPDSIRLETTVTAKEDLKAMAFLRPDNLIALVIFNSGPANVIVQVEDNDSKTAVIEIESNSLNTILYR